MENELPVAPAPVNPSNNTFALAAPAVKILESALNAAQDLDICPGSDPTSNASLPGLTACANVLAENVIPPETLSTLFPAFSSKSQCATNPSDTSFCIVLYSLLLYSW